MECKVSKKTKTQIDNLPTKINFNMEHTIFKDTATSFDNLPAEIIFMIFDYLSSNDIVYTFCLFSQRFEYLLLQNPRYLNHLEFPIRNLYTWKRIFSIIRFQIESFHIKSIDLSFPLNYFPNLKTVIIFSRYEYSNEQLKQILESESFTKLHTFKLSEEEQDHPSRLHNCCLPHRDDVLEKVFNHKSSLKTFQFSKNIKVTFSHLTNLETNSNLRSLTVFLSQFQDIFTILSYAPNLEYLKVHSQLPTNRLVPPINNNTKLKQFEYRIKEMYCMNDMFNILLDNIKYFSSSLNFLSIRIMYFSVRNMNDIPFISVILRQFFESMVQLKHFHLFVKLCERMINEEEILSNFQNQYWFDHQWFFGMHGRYFYTLPFYFHHLHEFYGDFNKVQSSNPEILENNPRIWYNVTSIDLDHPSMYTLDFLKQLKIKIPKLTRINFKSYPQLSPFSYTKKRQDNKHIVNASECLNDALPYLYHLAVSSNNLPPINNPLIDLLNKRIQRLDIGSRSFPLEELIKKEYDYFPNLQYLYLDLDCNDLKRCDSSVGTIETILKKSKELQTLTIYCSVHPTKPVKNITERFRHLFSNETKNFKMKLFCHWIIFSRVECDDDTSQTSELSSTLKK